MGEPKKDAKNDAPYDQLSRNRPWWKSLRLLLYVLSVILLSGFIFCTVFAVHIGMFSQNDGDYNLSFTQILSHRLSVQYVQFFVKEDNNDTCLTPGCIHAASSILESMDPNVDPCDNFYKFACGNFLNSTIIPDDRSSVNTFSVIGDKLDQQLRMSFEEDSKTNEPRPFKLVKNLYKSCMNKEAIDARGLEPLQKTVKELGGWPLFDRDLLWNENDFNWTTLIYKYWDIGHSINFPINFGIVIDPKNGTRHIINIDQPRLGLPRDYLLKSFKDEIIQSYYKYMIDISLFMEVSMWLDAIKELRTTLQFEIDLANITIPKEDRRDANKLYNPMNLTELTKNYPSIPWRQLFTKLLPSTIPLDENEIVNVMVPRYLTDVEKLIAATPKKTLANYIIWRIIENSISFLNEDVRKRQLAYSTVFTGKTERSPRWKECVGIVSDAMPMSVGAIYVRKYFNEDAKKNAIEMVTNIREEFVKTLKQVDWLDEKTRETALEKAAAMSSYIAYPDELLDDKKLEDFYKNLEISESNYFENVLNISAFGTEYNFGKLRETVDKHDWRMRTKTAVVNAFYSPTENNIQFPAGILQGKFFSNERPKYMNYGGIGFVIGHEITHGFDDEGRQFDKEGNIADWWAPATKEQYLKRAKCIVEQYGNYTVDEVGLNINGENTQGENIADNGGMKESYHAYNSWVVKNEEEQKLPGLSYTPKQMFWISAANGWCTKYRPKGLEYGIAEDVHSPAEFRILGTLSNIPEFSKDFNCPVGSKMNPVKKCTVW